MTTQDSAVTDDSVAQTEMEPTAAPVPNGRTIQVNLVLPNWRMASKLGARLHRPHLTRRRRRYTGAILLVLLIAGLFGLNQWGEAQNRNLEADTAAEMVVEGKAIESSSIGWANANQQDFIKQPSELRNMLPAHSGWASLASLPLTKSGVVVLPTQLKLYPSPPAGVHSLLVSRLHDLNTYVVFRFVSCDGKGVTLVAAPPNAEGITAVQQPFDLRTAKCPNK